MQHGVFDRQVAADRRRLGRLRVQPPGLLEQPLGLGHAPALRPVGRPITQADDLVGVVVELAGDPERLAVLGRAVVEPALAVVGEREVAVELAAPVVVGLFVDPAGRGLEVDDRLDRPPCSDSAVAR